MQTLDTRHRLYCRKCLKIIHEGSGIIDRETLRLIKCPYCSILDTIYEEWNHEFNESLGCVVRGI